MKFFTCAIKDRALNAFLPPFHMPAQAQAVREFGDAINKTENPMHNHPDDYDLYCLGIWDDESGRFEQLETPQQLAQGKNVIKQSS